MERCLDGEMARWRDGGMERDRDEEMEIGIHIDTLWQWIGSPYCDLVRLPPPLRPPQSAIQPDEAVLVGLWSTAALWGWGSGAPFEAHSFSPRPSQRSGGRVPVSVRATFCRGGAASFRAPVDAWESILFAKLFYVRVDRFEARGSTA